MRKSDKDKTLADNACLLRAWRRWHAEQLEAALAGPHAGVMGRLMAQLKDLGSARALVEFITAQDWSALDADTRLTALHQINNAVMRHRERAGLAPIDDALPGEPLNAFQMIRAIITTNSRSSGNACRRLVR